MSTHGFALMAKRTSEKSGEPKMELNVSKVSNQELKRWKRKMKLYHSDHRTFLLIETPGAYAQQQKKEESTQEPKRLFGTSLGEITVSLQDAARVKDLLGKIAEVEKQP